MNVSRHELGTNLEGGWDAVRSPAVCAPRRLVVLGGASSLKAWSGRSRVQVLDALKAATIRMHSSGVGSVTTTIKLRTSTENEYAADIKLRRIAERIEDARLIGSS